MQFREKILKFGSARAVLLSCQAGESLFFHILGCKSLVSEHYFYVTLMCATESYLSLVLDVGLQLYFESYGYIFKRGEREMLEVNGRSCLGWR